MGLKSAARPALALAARVPPVRRALIAYYDRRSTASGWNRTHPFDREHGTRTGGSAPGFLLGAGEANTPSKPYGGSQPSIVRRALATIPDPERFTFLDLGCGKGRVLAVASELAFREVVGIELSPELARSARDNARVVATRFPARPAIRVVTGDAVDPELAPGDLVIFLYNPFDMDLMAQLVANLERALKTEPRRMLVVYYNPACGEPLDRSPAFLRRHAETVAYDPSELGYGPDTADTVVVWQDAVSAGGTVPPGADRTIVVTVAGWRAELGGPPA